MPLMPMQRWYKLITPTVRFVSFTNLDNRCPHHRPIPPPLLIIHQTIITMIIIRHSTLPLHEVSMCIIITIIQISTLTPFTINLSFTMMSEMSICKVHTTGHSTRISITITKIIKSTTVRIV